MTTLELFKQIVKAQGNRSVVSPTNGNAYQLSGGGAIISITAGLAQRIIAELETDEAAKKST